MTHTHTHQLHNFDCRGINLCNACVSLVSACLASMTSQKGNYTTIMLGELIANYTHMHASYTSVIVGELIVCNHSFLTLSRLRFYILHPPGAETPGTHLWTPCATWCESALLEVAPSFLQITLSTAFVQVQPLKKTTAACLQEFFCCMVGPSPKYQEEKFRAVSVKRVVLANVPSFRFLGSVVLLFVPSFQFWGSVVLFFVLSFQYMGVQGTSAKTTLLETTLLRTPEMMPKLR